MFLKPSVFQQTEQSQVSNGKCEWKKSVTVKNLISNNVRQWNSLLKNFKILLVFKWITNCEVRETNNNNSPEIILFGSLLKIIEIHSPVDVRNHCWLSILIWKAVIVDWENNLTIISNFFALFWPNYLKDNFNGEKKNLWRLRLSVFSYSLFQKLRKVFLIEHYLTFNGIVVWINFSQQLAEIFIAYVRVVDNEIGKQRYQKSHYNVKEFHHRRKILDTAVMNRFHTSLLCSNVLTRMQKKPLKGWKL